MSPVPLPDPEFAALCRLLDAAAGLAFDESRRDTLALSVGDRMDAAGCPDVASYLALLRSPAGPAERQALLDEVTVQETHFFRNPPQVRALRRHVLPELVRAARAAGRPLRVWSAGCSTGEEPYTVAMLLREQLRSARFDVRVLGTDVSTRALATAARATYGERSLGLVEAPDRARWFEPAPDGGVRVRDEVRALVELRHHNLVTDPPPFGPGEVDLVLCRNVTIYFGRETTRALVDRLHGCLRDGGYLFLGHAETLWQVSAQLTLVPLDDAFVYRRLDGAAGPPVPAPATAASARTSRPRPPRQRPVQAPRPPEDRPDPLDAVAAAVRDGRYAEAADLALEVTTAAPLSTGAHYLHGLALTNLGRDQEALVSLRKAVYLDPRAGLAHFLLGGALDRLGERTAAAAAYRAAAATLPASAVDEVRAEFGGRAPQEAATLAARLAERAEAGTPERLRGTA